MSAMRSITSYITTKTTLPESSYSIYYRTYSSTLQSTPSKFDHTHNMCDIHQPLFSEQIVCLPSSSKNPEPNPPDTPPPTPPGGYTRVGTRNTEDGHELKANSRTRVSALNLQGL